MTPDERLHWLIDRQSGIGSSDAPDLCGIGYGDAARVYQEKTKLITLEAANHMPGYLKRGTVMEPLVAAEYSELMGGVELKKVPMVRHPERPWQTANIDYALASDEHDVEMKTVAGFGFDWGGSGTDDFPENYRTQCQHQMGVRGKEYCHLAALDIITWELRVYILTFSPYFWEWLTDVEARAWAMIEARTPIGDEWEAQWKAKAREMLELTDARAKLPPEAVPVLAKYKALGAIEKEAKELKGDCSTAIKAMMGEAYKAEVDGWKVSLSHVKPCTYTTTRDAYDRITVTPPSDREGSASKSRSKKVKVFK